MYANIYIDIYRDIYRNAHRYVRAKMYGNRYRNVYRKRPFSIVHLVLQRFWLIQICNNLGVGELQRDADDQ